MFTCAHVAEKRLCILYDTLRHDPPVRARLCFHCYDQINQNDDDDRNIFVLHTDGRERGWDGL